MNLPKGFLGREDNYFHVSILLFFYNFPVSIMGNKIYKSVVIY